MDNQSNGTENTVRAAAGVANIARGAAYGGLYGAAADVAVANSAAPEETAELIWRNFHENSGD